MSRAKRRKVEAGTTEPRGTRTALRREIRRLARDFADELLLALDRHGIWDPTHPRSARGRGRGRDGATSSRPKRVRRSTAALEKVRDKIVAELKGHDEPVAISTIAAALGAQPRQIAHPVALLVSRGLVIKTGERRGTRYQLARRRAAARGRRRAAARTGKVKRRTRR